MSGKKTFFVMMAITFALISGVINISESWAEPPGSFAPLSNETQQCIGCHDNFTPGIVEGWRVSRHAKITPQEALKKDKLARRISTESVPENLSSHPVGCYECHSLNTDKHKDSFEHFNFKINVVVSPNDCSTCHPAEAEQYAKSKKAYAYTNLMNNTVYHTLVDSITGIKKFENGKFTVQKPTQDTLNDVCLGCHGTKVEVKGTKKVMTKMGEMDFPNLTNWPNVGVGRLNPDGTRGSCTGCHPRHSFSIKDARKPYSCSQCHAEPDVPAWYVYKVSKHGNIYSGNKEKWNFETVPWVVGKDFKAPTCATCHNSLLTSPSGQVIAERTHDFGSRLFVRIFGIIYSHPQPKSGDTTIIKNSDDLPLATNFTGQPAHEYLIDKDEQEKRLNNFKNICNSCHSSDWVNLHFEKFLNTVKETDQMVLAATQLMDSAWKKKIEDGSNPFDETIEKLWIEQWLFYANTVRYASAMTGGYDYTGFNNGWWELSKNLEEMKDLMELKELKQK
jgi:hydroxylamine dehydrogenase